MRSVVGVVAMLVAGCADDPGPDSLCGNERANLGEECDPGPDGPYDGCTKGCTLPYAAVTARWSFETWSGDVKAPCLPGEPPVNLQVRSIGFPTHFQQTTSCSTGSLSFNLKHGLYAAHVTSVADHAYGGGTSVVSVDGPTDLPTVVVYTDVGMVLVRVTVYQADGVHNSCEYAGLARLRIVVDDTAGVSVDCANLIVDAVNSGTVTAGTHSVRVEGLDVAGNVVATSETVDVSVLGGSSTTVSLELRLPMP